MRRFMATRYRLAAGQVRLSLLPGERFLSRIAQFGFYRWGKTDIRGVLGIDGAQFLLLLKEMKARQKRLG